MQLTGISYNGTLRHEYRYSATANDGRITSYKNWQSGEDVQYQYDTLGRLTSAATKGLVIRPVTLGRSGCSRTGTTGGAMCC